MQQNIRVASEMIDWDLFWNYPWEGKVSCMATGLIKSAYPTAIKDKTNGRSGVTFSSMD